MLGLGLAAALVPALAQIRIGQTVGITGIVAATVQESMLGARLYLDQVNAKGGIGGERIELITLDDAFDVKKAEANARTLVEERGVLALFMSRGTPHTEAINAVLEQHHVALVGPSTGAMVLHQPLKRYIFNVRATYQREAERAMAHLASLGMQRVAIVHVDDSFGADGLEGARKGLRQAKLEPVAVAKFDRSKPDFAPVVAALKATEPQASLLIGSGTAVVDGVRTFRAAGIGGQYVTLSNNASAGFIKLLGDAGHGVVVSQVMPASQGYALVKEATQLAKAQGVDEISPAVLEGFASAKVLVEALRHAGPKPTRASVHSALENLGRVDLGGLVLDYSSADHTGLDFSDLSIITAHGKFRR
ncbi:ABC transporter substrate-binding protein [Curvibacter sp. APW13]|nr:ABC transporter substrate-binding protein [Curvibacter sp. APW13]MDT8990300.1 ABC transporter substrate-binding protein [Curvibacter sp. APW13]